MGAKIYGRLIPNDLEQLNNITGIYRIQ